MRPAVGDLAGDDSDAAQIAVDQIDVLGAAEPFEPRIHVLRQAAAANEAENFVALAKKKLREIGPVLTGCPSDERTFHEVAAPRSRWTEGRSPPMVIPVSCRRLTASPAASGDSWYGHLLLN